jgi:hypothetical protein
MLFKEKGINWNDTPTRYKRGVSFYKAQTELEKINSKEDPAARDQMFYRKKWVKDYEMPIITQDVNYINKWVEPEPIYFQIKESNPSLVFCEDIEIVLAEKDLLAV